MMNSTDRVPITSPHNLCRGHLGSSQSRLDRIAITSHFSLARGVSLPAEPVGSSRLGNGIGVSIDLAPGQHRPGDARPNCPRRRYATLTYWMLCDIGRVPP